MPNVYHYHETETKSTFVLGSTLFGSGFGTPGPCKNCDNASFKCLFRGFIGLRSAIGECTTSPEFTFKGNKWCIRFYPGGDSQQRAGCLSLYIEHCGGLSSLESDSLSPEMASFQVSILDKHQHVKFKKETTRGGGWVSICDRSIVLDPSNSLLDDLGTLAIVVNSSISSKITATSPYVPSNPMSDMIMGLFLDEDTADVRFEVSSGREDGDEAATATSTFHAHSQILQGCAPMLALLFGTNDEKIEAVSITDVEPAIFHDMLRYVYGGDVAEEELNAHAKAFIDATNKYDIVNLKLAAEAAYVKSIKITMDNAIESLLYADALNLALLKEAVVDFLVDNRAASLKLSFDSVPGNVMKDVFAAFCRKMEDDEEEENDDELSVMRVSELRMKLAENGLDVDGTRDAMIKALKEVKPNTEPAVSDGTFGSPAPAAAPAAPSLFGGVEQFRFRSPAAAAPSAFGAPAPAPAFGEPAPARGGFHFE